MSPTWIAVTPPESHNCLAISAESARAPCTVLGASMTTVSVAFNDAIRSTDCATDRFDDAVLFSTARLDYYLFAGHNDEAVSDFHDQRILLRSLAQQP